MDRGRRVVADVKGCIFPNQGKFVRPSSDVCSAEECGYLVKSSGGGSDPGAHGGGCGLSVGREVKMEIPATLGKVCVCSIPPLRAGRSREGNEWQKSSVGASCLACARGYGTDLSFPRQASAVAVRYFSFRIHFHIALPGDWGTLSRTTGGLYRDAHAETRGRIGGGSASFFHIHMVQYFCGQFERDGVASLVFLTLPYSFSMDLYLRIPVGEFWALTTLPRSFISWSEDGAGCASFVS